MLNLAPGTRLGPYEITAAIDAGGIGEAWRATDTRLGRHKRADLWAFGVVPFEIRSKDPGAVSRPRTH